MVIELANAKSLKDVKIFNTEKVLSCILERRSISRVELAEACSLAPSTIGQVVSGLVNDGLVQEYQAGASTGGRRPILLKVNPDYGRIVLFRISRDGLSAKELDLDYRSLREEKLSERMPAGNRLLEMTAAFVRQVQGVVGGRVLGVGLLCQDDIPEYDLMTEFSTGVMSDVVPVEKVLSARCNVPVKKELTNRYTLNCYLQNSGIRCENYAFLNLGERITASFVLNNRLVHNSNDAVFDVSSAVLAGSYAGVQMPGSPALAMAQELALKRLSLPELAEKLTGVINSALLFFPVDNVFVGGNVEYLDELVDRLTRSFYLKLAVWKADFEKTHISASFARQILLENYRRLLIT